MKKVLLILTCVVLIFACGKKESEVSKEEVTPTVATDTLTDDDRLEGKIVKSQTQEWFVIKNGERFRTMSEQSSADFFKAEGKTEEGNVVLDVPEETLEQFPIVGEILPNAVYKRY